VSTTKGGMSEATAGRNKGSRRRPKGYATWSPRKKTWGILGQVDEVLREYRAHLPLTVRQIFYRLVGAFDYPKTEKAYNNLGDKLVRARRSGMIPFELIRDDSASVMDHLHFDDEEHFYAHVHELGRNFTLNKQAAQRIEIRVYCEAAGMMPQLHAALEPYSVPVYSCSGFDSLTFKHQLARWFSETYAWRGKVPVMLHLGDYDPDGESIFDVISEDAVAFLGRDAPQLVATYGRDLLFNRVALTEWQVDHYGLPTAPPKETSSRTRNWKGSRTCQLEALPPDILKRRVVGTVEGYLDGDTLEAGRKEEVTARRNIAGALPSVGGAP
jgi:hypothetical protein